VLCVPGMIDLRPNADPAVSDARRTLNHTLCLAPLDYPRQPGQSILEEAQMMDNPAQRLAEHWSLRPYIDPSISRSSE
jgi:hypothetical protein